MQHRSSWFRSSSITSQRSRYQLKIAIALTVVIPMLSFCYLALSMFTSMVTSPVATQVGVMVAGMTSGILGYTILRHYPANIERLRDYLERMAAEDLPEQATLVLGEQDMAEIEGHLNTVIRGLQDKITRLDEQLTLSRQMVRTIQNQSDEIVAAEQHRVMIESLGAACHHLGQPATILSLYLSRVRDLRPEVLNHEEFEACSRAVEEIGDILKKLKHVGEYRTRPYTTFMNELDPKLVGRSRILDIDQDELALEEQQEAER
jgi:phosphoglycerate-specific signal transduction histidine kinase